MDLAMNEDVSRDEIARLALPVRLVLVDPPAGVDFGIQRGRGSAFETAFVQQRTRGDIVFDFSITVVGDGKSGSPDFRGPFVQGPRAARFVYVGVGTFAGQIDSCWSRRMKVQLQGITWPLVRQATSRSGARLVARIPGTGRDGGPSCATVKLLGEWRTIGDS
jgi:hypothetical protein